MKKSKSIGKNTKKTSSRRSNRSMPKSLREAGCKIFRRLSLKRPRKFRLWTFKIELSMKSRDATRKDFIIQ